MPNIMTFILVVLNGLCEERQNRVLHTVHSGTLFPFFKRPR